MADTVGTAFLELRADASKLFSDLNSLAGRLNGVLGSAFKDITKNVEGFSKGLEGLVSGFNKLGGEGSALSGALESVVGGIKNALGGFAALGPAGAGVAIAVAGVTVGIGAMVAAIGIAGVELFSLMTHAADAGEALIHLHDQTGLSVKALQEFKFVSEQTTVPLETITGAVFKLGQTISEGGDKAAKGLGAIGVSFDQIRKLSPDKAFELVITKLGQIPDAGQRAAAGVALFGKKFKDVAQLTQQDMQGLIDKADETGRVLPTAFAVAGLKFNVAVRDIGGQIEALKLKIGAEFLPIATAFIQVIGEGLQKALAAASVAFGGTGISVTKLGVNVAQVAVLTVSALADMGTGIASWVSSVVLGIGAVISGFGSFVAAMAKVVSVQETLTLSGHEQSKWISSVGADIKGFGVATEDSAHRALVGIEAFSKGQHDAAQRMTLEIPFAVARVSQSIREQAAAMDAADASAGGFGKGLAKGASDAEKASAEAAKKIAELALQIDAAATRGMSAGEMVRLFGKKAIEASDEAERFGLTTSEGLKAIAQDAKDLVKQDFYAKLADQARAGNLKIIAEADKRQQAELSDQLKMATANINYEKDKVDLYRTGADAQIVQIERARDAELAALPVETDANKSFLAERRQQITEAAQWRIDAANGMYHTLNELEQASGAKTVADLREAAQHAADLYAQMRDSGAFSARDVQTAWENSVKAQALAIGGVKGDALTMYAELGTKLSDTLADMATHWKNWKDDLKKLWSDIAGDFTAMLANMLKQFIEGFLMKMLAAIAGSQGEFSSGWSGLLSGASGGGGGGGGGWGGLVRNGIGIGAGAGASAAFGAGTTGGLIFGAGAPAGSAIIGVPTTFGAGAGGSAGAGIGSAAAIGALSFIGGGLLAAKGISTMMKAHTTGQNVLGGVETGAGIGTMILPGIGTVIGAGIGAIAGLIKSRFVSKYEKQGRAVVSDFQQNTFANLTDAQRNEAQGAVASGAWTDPKAAGMLIAVRDAYLSMGKTAQQAQDDVKAFWDAEKKGPEATTAAMQPLLDALDQQKQKQDAAHTDLLAHQQDINDAVDSTRVTLEKLGPAGEVATNHIMEGLADLAAKGEWTSDQISTLIGGSLEALGPEGETVARYIQEKWDDLGKAGQAAVGGIGDAFGDLPAAASSAARDAVQGFETQFTKIRMPEIDWKINPNFQIDPRAYNSMPSFPMPPVIPMEGGGMGRVTGRTYFVAGENGDEDFAFSGGGKRFGGGGTPANIAVTVEVKAVNVDGADVRAALVSTDAKRAVADAYHEAIVNGGNQFTDAQRMVRSLQA